MQIDLGETVGSIVVHVSPLFQGRLPHDLGSTEIAVRIGVASK